MLKIVFQIVARLPLWFLHQMANCLGYVVYYIARRERLMIRANLRKAGLRADSAAVKRVLQETIKSGLELPFAFFRQPEEISALFQKVEGWEAVQEAIDEHKGLLFITPHIGSYDLAGRYISERLPFPLTAMYKPPKIKALDDVMRLGRKRAKGDIAPTNKQGVKQIIQALRRGEATIILPDHVPDPKEGEGVWAKFFDHDAYTMTLAGKLAQVKNVATFFFVGERLGGGRGFVLHIEPFSGCLNGDKEHDALLINRQVEYWIRRFPDQYLFAYNRYKKPMGVAKL